MASYCVHKRATVAICSYGLASGYRMGIYSLVTLLLGFSTSAAAALNGTVNFAYITSFEGEFTSAETIPAMNLALQKINSNNEILSGYKLAYRSVLDSAVSSTLSHNINCGQ